MRALYHGSLRFVDDQVARLVADLKQSGQWDSTVLVFTSDHGEMLGDHGLIAKGTRHYDACIRVPFLVAGGGVSATGAGGGADAVIARSLRLT